MQYLPNQKNLAEIDTERRPKNHNNLTGYLPLITERSLHTPPFPPVFALIDAPLRRPNHRVGLNRISGIDFAIVIGEDAQGVHFFKAGAEVYGDGVEGGVKGSAFIVFDVGGVAGAIAFAVGVGVGTYPGVFSQGSGGEEGEEESEVVHDEKGEVGV